MGDCLNEIVEGLVRLNAHGPIGADYIRGIAEACSVDIVEDLLATTDAKTWNSDDLRMAFGRVLSRHLGLAV